MLSPNRNRRSRLPFVLTAGVVVAIVVAAVVLVRLWPSSSGAPRGAKTSCVYPQNSIAALKTFDTTVGTTTTCALVYNDTAASWDGLEKPWFVQGNDTDHRWDSWVRGGQGRMLVIGQSLVPANPPADWRVRGAAGEYDAHFTALAHNLVAAGLGRSVIRLAFEGNGDWFTDNAGSSRAQYKQWTAYWARVAAIFHKTAGAHFLLDWTVTAGVRPIPLDQWYPGDKAVDIVGVDQHDIAEDRIGTAQPARWNFQVDQPDGINAVIAFADRHHKQLSFPEWGVDGTGVHGAGDDPYYVEQMGRIFATENVAYQGYWDKSGTGAKLSENPRSLTAYKKALVAAG